MIKMWSLTVSELLVGEGVGVRGSWMAAPLGASPMADARTAVRYKFFVPTMLPPTALRAQRAMLIRGLANLSVAKIPDRCAHRGALVWDNSGRGKSAHPQTIRTGMSRVLPEKCERFSGKEARQNKKLGSFCDSIKTGRTLANAM